MWGIDPDSNGNDVQPFENGPLRHSSKMSYSKVAAAGGKWIPVVHSFNKKKKTPMVSAIATEQSYMFSNRFTPLTENQTMNINPRTNCEWPSATNFTKKKKNTIQPSAGNKIPTIINGKITNAETKKPSSSLKNSSI